MCNLSGVLGDGPVLILQGLTAISIAASIFFWAWLFLRGGLKRELALFALPIALWVLFGSLDILITANGTFDDPYREGNQAARFIFVETGVFGPIVASVSWIALWAGLVFALNYTKTPFAIFISLAVFYSLATGHLLGFSSWFMPLCQISRASYSIAPFIPRALMIVLAGCIAAGAHMAVPPLIGRLNEADKKEQ